MAMPITGKGVCALPNDHAGLSPICSGDHGPARPMQAPGGTVG